MGVQRSFCKSNSVSWRRMADEMEHWAAKHGPWGDFHLRIWLNVQRHGIFLRLGEHLCLWVCQMEWSWPIPFPLDLLLCFSGRIWQELVPKQKVRYRIPLQSSFSRPMAIHKLPICHYQFPQSDWNRPKLWLYLWLWPLLIWCWRCFKSLAKQTTTFCKTWRKLKFCLHEKQRKRNLLQTCDRTCSWTLFGSLLNRRQSRKFEQDQTHHLRGRNF